MIELRPHQLSALDAMSASDRGQIIVPTGGGKTICMIEDVKRQFKSPVANTIVVVAPRILLANQLCSEFLEQNLDGNYNVGVAVAHVHSGETHYYSTTKASRISVWSTKNVANNQIIFTTYHSLHRIQESGIHVDTIYFDEAHNAVQKNFIEAVEYYSMYASRCYFFTATPKHSIGSRVGMNDTDIFGGVICNVPAPKLVKQGYILPPKVVIKKIDLVDDSRFKHEQDCDCVLDTIDDQDVDKILICARSTKQIINLVSQTSFINDLSCRGYSWMMITSKTGAVIDGKKVNREEFFNTLNTWGKDSSKRFVVMHHSILSEGINVKGLEAAMFLRNMDYIGISQTIGRVIRKGDESKTFGLICVPVYDKVGISTSRKVQTVVDTVFNQGEPAISVVRN
jgi:predicted helicase